MIVNQYQVATLFCPLTKQSCQGNLCALWRYSPRQLVTEYENDPMERKGQCGLVTAGGFI